MAKQERSSSKSTQKIQRVTWNFPYTRNNFILFGVGILVIAFGYALMSTGITDDPAKHQEAWGNPLAVSVAPVVLTIGYCVIIPMAIMMRFKKKTEE